MNERPQAPIETHEVRRETPQSPPSNSQRRLAAAALGGALLIALIASVVILGAGSTRSPVTPGSNSTIGYTSPQTTSKSTSTSTSTSANPSPPVPPALVAVSTYWEAIARHDFAAAYAILAPGAVPQSEAQWVANEQSTGVERIRFKGEVGASSGTAATITVVSLVTVDRQFGCRSWTGTYEMTNQGGRWLIARANLTPRSCMTT
jgi:hypothetical protein